MKSRKRLIIGLVVLAVFGTLAMINLNRTITPYVSFTEAKASTRTVQVAGFPDHAHARFDTQVGVFRFDMTDENGEVLPVASKGVKPGNFDQAQSVVVIGKVEDGTLNADQILVKCPSKYEAEAEQGMKHPGPTGQEGTAAPTPTAAKSAAETD